MMIRFRSLRNSEKKKVSEALKNVGPAVERTLNAGKKALALTVAAVALQACGDGKEVQIITVPGERVEIYSQSLEVARRLCPQKVENSPGVVDTREITDNSLTTSNNPAGISPANNQEILWVANWGQDEEGRGKAQVDTVVDGELKGTDNLTPVSDALKKKKECEGILEKRDILAEELGENDWRTMQAEEDARDCIEELNKMQFESNVIDGNGNAHRLFLCNVDGNSATFASPERLREVPVEGQ